MKTPVLVVLAMVAPIWAVETIVLQPDCDEGKDAYVTFLHPGLNFGFDQGLAIAFGWAPYYLTLIQFNLPELPTDAELVSVDLVLWCSVTLYDVEYINIVAVQDRWQESWVTWNNQPEYRPDKIIIARPPEGDDTWAYFNITTFVADWYNSEYENNGMYLIPGTMSFIGFASSDERDEDIHPKLIIRYSSADVEETSWGEIKAHEW
jgi:hypothetical protein